VYITSNFFQVLVIVLSFFYFPATVKQTDRLLFRLFQATKHKSIVYNFLRQYSLEFKHVCKFISLRFVEILTIYIMNFKSTDVMIFYTGFCELAYFIHRSFIQSTLEDAVAFLLIVN